MHAPDKDALNQLIPLHLVLRRLQRDLYCGRGRAGLGLWDFDGKLVGLVLDLGVDEHHLGQFARGVESFGGGVNDEPSAVVLKTLVVELGFGDRGTAAGLDGVDENLLDHERFGE